MWPHASTSFAPSSASLHRRRSARCNDSRPSVPALRICIVTESMRRPTALILLSLTFLSWPALAQFSQQGPKLFGAGGAGNEEEGYSVSLSADGNTAIVGAPRDNNGIGAAWIWTRSGGIWTQKSAKLLGSDAVGN